MDPQKRGAVFHATLSKSPIGHSNVSTNPCRTRAESLRQAAMTDQGMVLFASWLYRHDGFRQERIVLLFMDWRASVEADPRYIHAVLPERRCRSRNALRVADCLPEHLGIPACWETAN